MFLLKAIQNGKKMVESPAPAEPQDTPLHLLLESTACQSGRFHPLKRIRVINVNPQILLSLMNMGSMGFLSL
jgi:hypothetical protein